MGTTLYPAVTVPHRQGAGYPNCGHNPSSCSYCAPQDRVLDTLTAGTTFYPAVTVPHRQGAGYPHCRYNPLSCSYCAPQTGCWIPSLQVQPFILQLLCPTDRVLDTLTAGTTLYPAVTVPNRQGAGYPHCGYNLLSCSYCAPQTGCWIPSLQAHATLHPAVTMADRQGAGYPHCGYNPLSCSYCAPQTGSWIPSLQVQPFILQLLWLTDRVLDTLTVGTTFYPAVTVPHRQGAGYPHCGYNLLSCSYCAPQTGCWIPSLRVQPFILQLLCPTDRVLDTLTVGTTFYPAVTVPHRQGAGYPNCGHNPSSCSYCAQKTGCWIPSLQVQPFILQLLWLTQRVLDTLTVGTTFYPAVTVPHRQGAGYPHCGYNLLSCSYCAPQTGCWIPSLWVQPFILQLLCPTDRVLDTLTAGTTFYPAVTVPHRQGAGYPNCGHNPSSCSYCAQKTGCWIPSLQVQPFILQLLCPTDRVLDTLTAGTTFYPAVTVPHRQGAGYPHCGYNPLSCSYCAPQTGCWIPSLQAQPFILQLLWLTDRVLDTLTVGTILYPAVTVPNRQGAGYPHCGYNLLSCSYCAPQTGCWIPSLWAQSFILQLLCPTDRVLDTLTVGTTFYPAVTVPHRQGAGYPHCRHNPLSCSYCAPQTGCLIPSLQAQPFILQLLCPTDRVLDTLTAGTTFYPAVTVPHRQGAGYPHCRYNLLSCSYCAPQTGCWIPSLRAQPFILQLLCPTDRVLDTLTAGTTLHPAVTVPHRQGAGYPHCGHNPSSCSYCAPQTGCWIPSLQVQPFILQLLCPTDRVLDTLTAGTTFYPAVTVPHRQGAGYPHCGYNLLSCSYCAPQTGCWIPSLWVQPFILQLLCPTDRVLDTLTVGTTLHPAVTVPHRQGAGYPHCGYNLLSCSYCAPQTGCWIPSLRVQPFILQLLCPTDRVLDTLTAGTTFYPAVTVPHRQGAGYPHCGYNLLSCSYCAPQTGCWIPSLQAQPFILQLLCPTDRVLDTLTAGTTLYPAVTMADRQGAGYPHCRYNLLSCSYCAPQTGCWIPSLWVQPFILQLLCPTDRVLDTLTAGTTFYPAVTVPHRQGAGYPHCGHNPSSCNYCAPQTGCWIPSLRVQPFILLLLWLTDRVLGTLTAGTALYPGFIVVDKQGTGYPH